MSYKKLIEQYKDLEKKFLETPLPLGSKEASELVDKLHEMEIEGMEHAIQSLIEKFELNNFSYKIEFIQSIGNWGRLESLVREVIKDGVVKMCGEFGFKMSEDSFGLTVDCSLLGVENLLNEELQKRLEKDLFFGRMSYLSRYSFKRKKWDDGDWVRVSDDIKFCLDLEKEE